MITIGRVIASILFVAAGACGLSQPEPAAPPVAFAHVAEDWECQVKDSHGNRFYVDVCGRTGEEVFVVYDRFDVETLDHYPMVAIGQIPVVLTGEGGLPLEFVAPLYEAEVLSTGGGWHEHDYHLTVRQNDKERTLFFTPSGQPDLVGEYVLLMEEVPAGVAKLLPEDGEIGYYGILPGTGQRFAIYSVPLPPPAEEEENDEISELIRILHPRFQVELRVLMGGSTLKAVEVEDTYSYGGGAHIYIDTAEGLFLLAGRGDHAPIWGTRSHRYYVPSSRGY
jgi:hypothetical protein